MNDRGQFLLLSALIVCACLIALAACLYSVDTSYSDERLAIQREDIDNVAWVQDAGLTRAAGESGCCQWEERTSLAVSFKSRAYLPVSSIEMKMQVRGIAYSFVFNESLAVEYLKDSDMPSVESIDGILIKREGDNASVFGYAYDMSLADGLSRYYISKVKTLA